VFERIFISDVVDETAAVSTAVESRRQGLETFLASRVPNLKNHDSIFEHDFLVREVSADSWLEVFSEARVLEHLNEGRLADGTVANDDHLDEVFAGAGLWGRLKSLGRISVVHCLCILLGLHYD